VDQRQRQHLQEQLTRTSLDEDEANVYLALLDLGTSKARTVAEETEIHRTTAYRILKDLADDGLVEVGVGRPMEFTAASPERLFEEIRREKAKELDQIDDVEDEVVGDLESLRAAGDDESSEARWQMLKGRERIVEKGIEMLEAADEELRYLATAGERSASRGDTEADWQSAVAEASSRLDTRFLVNPQFVSDDVLDAMGSIKGVDLRGTKEADRALSALIDGEVIIWVVIGEEPEDDVALWSNASDLYTSQRILFDGLWEKADPVGG
jgi:sugar-specific transcriptional regulator TrmB